MGGGRTAKAGGETEGVLKQRQRKGSHRLSGSEAGNGHPSSSFEKRIAGQAGGGRRKSQATERGRADVQALENTSVVRHKLLKSLNVKRPLSATT